MLWRQLPKWNAVNHMPQSKLYKCTVNHNFPHTQEQKVKRYDCTNDSNSCGTPTFLSEMQTKLGRKQKTDRVDSYLLGKSYFI